MAAPADLRTYLLLERAFVRRLQRSWQQQSAPIYAQITQHCQDKQWDKARLLVPTLDMSEVGTQNREWITYMLLSCAVFGAQTISKKKPSFVGVGKFDAFLTQVSSNILQYLEYNATAQVQTEAMQLIARDEAQTKEAQYRKAAWDEAKHPRDRKGRFTESGARLTDAGDEPSVDWWDPHYTPGSPPKKGDSVVVFRVGRAEGLEGRNAANAEGVITHLLNHQDYGKDPMGDTLTAYRVTLTEDMQAGYVPVREGDAPEAMPTEAVGRGNYFMGLGYTFPASGKGFTAEPLFSIPVAELDLTQSEAMHRLTAQIRQRVTKKWEESQHPRDKDGQFTERGTRLPFKTGDSGDDSLEGSGGPIRAQWKALNEAEMAAFEAHLDARNAHRVNVDRVYAKIEARMAAGEPQDEAEKMWGEEADAEYLRTKKAAQATKDALTAAELARQAIEPAMQTEVIQNVATSMALQLGFDPDKIDVVYMEPRPFDVGGVQMREAGHYNPGDGRIEINAKNTSYSDTPNLKGIIAHEITHHIYHTIKDAADKEFEQYLKLAIDPVDSDQYTPWFDEYFYKKPGEWAKTVRPEKLKDLQRLFPASAVMAHLAGGAMFAGISSEMVKEDGHSHYAETYWTPEGIAARGRTYDTAINETMAEISRYLTSPTSWSEPKTPLFTSPWTKLTMAMHTWYKDTHEMEMARYRDRDAQKHRGSAYAH